jgi:hypothetical protein
MGEDARLPGPGTRQDEERSLAVLDRAPLVRVEVREQPLDLGRARR